LIDLQPDTDFWLQRVPKALSEKHGMTLEQARQTIHQEYMAVQHTMNWYSFDYWSERLDLDIYQMTTNIGKNARLREDTVPFLQHLRNSGRETILLTNAHPHSLSVKIEHTGLDKPLDLLLSTHTFGYPKEDQRLWSAVQQQTGFNPARTLFVDDGEPILNAAKTFGIRYCLGIENPDSSGENKSFQGHPSINDYRDLLPSIHPVTGQANPFR